MTAVPDPVPAKKDARDDAPDDGSGEIVGDLGEFLEGDGRDEDD